jgi:hypothetical protein
VALTTYWLVFQNASGTEIFIQPGYSLLDAKMKGSIPGHQGELKESHALDGKAAKKVPASAIGRTLTAMQAKKLLARM